MSGPATSRQKQTRAVGPIAPGEECIRLLVSVRNSGEAAAALAGGADVIDVKEPRRGSLGMAAIDEIQGVAAFLQNSPTRVPLSVALGELSDWPEDEHVPSLPADVEYVKLGLADAAGMNDWGSIWLDVRRRFEQAAESQLSWVAVVYADSQSANSPSADEVVQAAVQTGCRGILFDTFAKQAGTLFDALSPGDLQRFIECAQRHGLFVALAGRISVDDLQTAGTLPLDVVAVRSAACEDGVRDRSVVASRVRELRRRLNGVSESVDRRVAVASRFIRDRWPQVPRVGLILGTGLGDLVSGIETETTLPYEEIPYFPRSNAIGHAGRLTCGTIRGLPVIAMEGRCHAYEGYRLDEITLPVRVMHRLGAELLIVSNAAGGLNPRLRVGDVVLIDEYVNMMFARPSPRSSVTESRTSVPERSNPDDSRWSDIALSAAREAGVTLERGTYVAVTGPNYETRAEYRFYRGIGGDVIGMSTAPELVVAAQLGLSHLAFSIVTNCCNPDAPSKTDGAAVAKAAKQSSGKLGRLVNSILDGLPVE